MRGSLRPLVAPAAALGRRLSGLLPGFARAAFPVACASCGGPHEGGPWPLCAPCDAALPVAGEPFCLTCARAGGSPRACLARAHVGLRAAFVWSPGVRAVVHAYKFGDAPELAAALVRRAATTPGFRAGRGPDLLAPVPLHPLRRRERGYDQAGRLAEAWSRALGAPTAPALERARRTRQQARLSARERAANVQGAFRVALPAVVAGRRVALVDDVVTTGETLVAAAAALASAGAARVEGWALAYEPLA